MDRPGGRRAGRESAYNRARRAPSTASRRQEFPQEVQVRFPRLPLAWFFLAVALPCLSQGQSAQDGVGPILAALRSHDFPKALKLSQTALAAQPGDCRLWTLHGMATGGMGDPASALKDYEHALHLAPGYPPALEGAAQTSFELGRRSAGTFLAEILSERPDDPVAHALLGILDYRAGHCKEAVDHFARATPVISRQPAALTDYGVCLAALKRNDDAATAFAQALAVDPARREARFNLALAQWDANRADEALHTLQPLLQEQPADPDAMVLGAEILESKNQTAEAVPLLRKALLANPRDLNAYMQFAILSYNHASPQVGIDIVNYGLRQMPKQPRLYLVRGILLTQLGQFARAADDFETANRLDPNLQFLGVAQGLVESQQHNPDQALAKFRSAVEAHPDEAYAWYLLAEELAEQNTQPGSPAHSEELAAAKKAVELDPGLVPAHDLLSTLYYQSGQKELAIRESRAALARDPDDEQAVYHLVLALRGSGRSKEVSALVKRLVQLQADTQSRAGVDKRYRLYERPGLAAPK